MPPPARRVCVRDCHGARGAAFTVADTVLREAPWLLIPCRLAAMCFLGCPCVIRDSSGCSVRSCKMRGAGGEGEEGGTEVGKPEAHGSLGCSHMVVGECALRKPRRACMMHVT